MNKKSILGVDITIDSQEDILEEIIKYLTLKNKEQRTKNKKSIKPLMIITPNPEIINYAQKDNEFKQIVNSSQINIPDGMGICWAINQLYGLKVKRLSGADLMLSLCKIAYEKRLTIGLIGGRRGIAVKTRECLLKKYPKLKVEVFEAPEVEISNIKDNTSFEVTRHREPSGVAIPNGIGAYQRDCFSRLSRDRNDNCLKRDEYFSSLGDEIIKRQINILFVGFGFPKQEYFINFLNSYFQIHNSTPTVMMAVGGAFDYITGNIPRAPIWIREVGFEWLFRLIREPMRLGRQIRGAKFFIDVAISRLNTLQ